MLYSIGLGYLSVALMFKMPQQVVDKKLNMVPFYKKSLLMLYMPSVVQVMMTDWKLLGGFSIHLHIHRKSHSCYFGKTFIQ